MAVVDMPSLFGLAALSATASLACLVVAAITIALFFGGAGERYGPINDVFSALSLAFLALPVVAVWMIVDDETGAWFAIVSVLALAGITLAAVGQVALVVGRISLATSFVTGGIGILPVLAWSIAVAYLAFVSAALPDMIGWSGLAVLGLVAVTSAVAFLTKGPLLWVACAALTLSLCAFLGSLAIGFLDAA